MNNMGLSEKLREEADSIWQAIFKHPFLVEMSRGILPMKKFKFYLRQDYLYLMDFCRALAVAEGKIQDVKDLKDFTAFLYKEIALEIGGLERYAESIGVSTKQLSKSNYAPVTYAYTRHVLYSAYADPFSCFLSLIMPCMQLYLEIAEKIGDEEGIKKIPAYSKWLATYQTKEYADLVDWLNRLLNKYSQGSSQWEISRMRTLYLTSSRYEYMFWDMAYKLEGWRI